MAYWKSAEKRSFEACRETCPKVDTEADKLDSLLKNAADFFDAYRQAEQAARDELRSALTDAYEKIIDLEGEILDANKRIANLEDQLASAVSDLQRVENLTVSRKRPCGASKEKQATSPLPGFLALKRP
jgi:predicted  nucleic acid-binding Zn-ribbon protein